MKKIISIIILFFTVVLIVGCSELTKIYPTITIDNYNIEVDLGDNILVSPQVEGFEGTPNLIYTTSNPLIFDVDNGIINPISVGEGELTIKLSETSAQITVYVKVVDSSLELSFSNEELSLEIEESIQLQLLANDSLYNGDIDWSSNNLLVATVDDGLVTAKSGGIATITAIVGSESVTINILVNNELIEDELIEDEIIEDEIIEDEIIVEEPKITSLVIEGVNNVIVDEAIALKVMPNIDIVADVIWSTDNELIAQVFQNGHVFGVSEGTVTIYATLISDNTVVASKTVEVTAPPALKITAEPSSTINVGDKNYQIYITDHNGISISRLSCEFTSSNPEVATVSAYGTITALSEGTVTITVKSDRSSGTIILDVTDIEIIENKRNDIITIAIAEDGFQEGPNNDNKYGEWYGWNNVPWCAIFVSWAADQAGVPTTIIPKYASVAIGLEWYRSKGPEFYQSYQNTIDDEYTPIAGDIVFFKSNGASHTALVIKVVGDRLYTIEGNTSDSVKLRWYYYKNYDKITGYGIPNYPQSSGAILDFDVTKASFGGGSSTT